MLKWSRETCLIFGVVVLLVGLEFMCIQQLILTKETTLFVARQTNHPQLAAAQSMEQLTGSSTVKPLQVTVWTWFGRGIALAGGLMIVRNAGKNS